MLASSSLKFHFHNSEGAAVYPINSELLGSHKNEAVGTIRDVPEKGNFSVATVFFCRFHISSCVGAVFELSPCTLLRYIAIWCPSGLQLTNSRPGSWRVAKVCFPVLPSMNCNSPFSETCETT